MNDTETNDSHFYFNVISGLFLLSFGIIFNSMVILVFMSKGLRDQSMNRYLICLALSDSIELITSVIFNLSPYIDFSELTFFCKLNAGFMVMFFQYCSILIMISSIDRFISVVYAKKFQFKNSIKFQLILLFTAFLTTLPTSAVFSLFYTSKNIHDKKIFCDFEDSHTAASITIVNLVLSTLIPFFVMIASTLVLFKKVKLLRNKLNVRSVWRQKEVKKEFQILKTMIGIDTFFFICNTPICVYVIAVGFSQKLNNHFIFSILNLVSTFHNAFPFLVYLICNNVFRQQLLSILFKSRNLRNNSVNAVDDTRSEPGQF